MATTVQQPQQPQMAMQTPVKPSEGLPGLLEFPDEGEDSLLGHICSQTPVQLGMLQFKLAPVYTMYMMLRFRLSQKYKSNLSFNEKLTSSSLLIHKMVGFVLWQLSLLGRHDQI
jgi:hypothetical protein